MFSWAVERKVEEGTQRQPEGHFRKLELLEIRMNTTVAVVYDAMTTFEPSL